jgi:hypothetical protein
MNSSDSSNVSGLVVLLLIGAFLFTGVLPLLLSLLLPLLLIGAVLAVPLICLRAYGALMLQQDVAVWSSSNKGRVCRFGNQHGFVEELSLKEGAGQQQLTLKLQMLERRGQSVQLVSTDVALPQLQRNGRGLAAALRKPLQMMDVEVINELAVESKAMDTARAWLQQLDWCHQALDAVSQMRADLAQTLQIAPGNELLEPSLPELERAKQRFDREWRELGAGLAEAEDVLDQLLDFLSVPTTVRSVINVDQHPFETPRRLQALRQSFEDVVVLNNTFRDLSRQKLA